MSRQSYQKALAIMDSNKAKCHFIGPRSEELISLAEEKLGLKFSGLYRDFLKNFGAGNFGAQEIYGIVNEDFENSSVPDAVWYALTERREVGLPENLLVIYHTGSYWLYCLDFNRLNEEGEPAVVSFAPGFDLAVQEYEIIADDFGDFLLDLVSREVPN